MDGMTVSISGFVDRVDGWEHDGRLYLRVVDYKTGRKTFDLTDIWNGMGLQMLLYLFTLEREGEALYNREIIPAGVLYLPARDAVVAGSRAMSEAERRRKVDAELRRRGIVLDEPEVLAAMEEPGEAGIRFLPVKVNKAGAITGEALVSAERLGKLAGTPGGFWRRLAGSWPPATSPPTPSGGGRITMPASGASTPPPVTSRRVGAATDGASCLPSGARNSGRRLRKSKYELGAQIQPGAELFVALDGGELAQLRPEVVQERGGGALSKAGHVSIDNGKLLAVFWRSLMDHQLL